MGAGLPRETCVYPIDIGELMLKIKVAGCVLTAVTGVWNASEGLAMTVELIDGSSTPMTSKQLTGD